jgi:hypothetical protein
MKKGINQKANKINANNFSNTSTSRGLSKSLENGWETDKSLSTLGKHIFLYDLAILICSKIKLIIDGHGRNIKSFKWQYEQINGCFNILG